MPDQKTQPAVKASLAKQNKKLNPITLVVLAILAFVCAYVATRFVKNPRAISLFSPEGMVWIPGGEYTMGNAEADALPTEKPTRLVRLDGFYMDATEVTNEQFRAFIKATGYVTTAEKAPDWEDLKKQLPPGTPKPPDKMLVPGSLVFTPTNHAVPTNNMALWWTWTPGATWLHPEGPGSNLEGRENHPVVHVSWDDATAYAKWAGKRLPTEAEWEYASRGGLVGKRYNWGNEPLTDTEGTRANIWQGKFPYLNLKVDKWERTSPVKSYPPNAYGLYDMAGNVWEWVTDWYSSTYYYASSPEPNPSGPNLLDGQYRVLRGGSWGYGDNSVRSANRDGYDPISTLSILGFRCARTP